MTSRFQKIRDWLAAQDGPRSPGDIAAGIGAVNSRAFSTALANMRRDGWLTREREGTRWVYRVKAFPAPKKRFTTKQLIERRRARDREKSRARGVRPMEQWIAERTQRVEERRQAKASAAAAERARRAAAKARHVKPLHDRKPKPHVVVSLTPPPAPRKETPRETVEQWMERTGKKPQVLPLGAVSQPLRIAVAFNNRRLKAA